MNFKGTLESVCDYLEITSVYSDKIRPLLSKIMVTNIECDTRRVTKGTIFYAKKGAHFNPFEHLEEIKAKGAVAILVDAPSSYEEQTEWQLNYGNIGDQLKEGFNAALSESVEQKLRSGKSVITKYISDPKRAKSEYLASQNTPEAKAITDAKMLRLVLPSNKSLSALAGFIYGNPSEKLRLIGVTGTNGKSTITNLIAQMLNQCGHKCVLFGTLGYGFLGELQESANTTLDAISLQRELANYVSQGADYAIMEVSSIGFCEGRVSGLNFYAGAFSNLSRDHLDYHHNMRDYLSAKTNFLKMIPPKHLVVNCINQEGRDIASEIKNCYQVTMQNSLSESTISTALNVQNIKYESSYTEVAISLNAKKVMSTKLGLLGKFNVENFAVALGVLVAMDYDVKFLMRHASKLKPITGRMDCFCIREMPRLIVDYAHTPDGVEQALRAARNHTQGKGRIFAIVGCGGDRDSGKRPIMALKSSVYADYAIFTADNPRSENLENILSDMLMGIETVPDEFVKYRFCHAYSQVSLLNREYSQLVLDKLNALLGKHRSLLKTLTLSLELKLTGEQCLEQHLESLGDINEAVALLEQVLNECGSTISFENYDKLRVRYDETLVNQAYKGEYYQGHQAIFGLPIELVKNKSFERNVFVIPDRYQAIRFAFEHANKHDCVVIAGKGHEDYQIFVDKTIHFSDREICCELLGIDLEGNPLDTSITGKSSSSRSSQSAAAQSTVAETELSDN